jgi:hypothetical protein
VGDCLGRTRLDGNIYVAGNSTINTDGGAADGLQVASRVVIDSENGIAKSFFLT